MSQRVNSIQRVDWKKNDAKQVLEVLYECLNWNGRSLKLKQVNTIFGIEKGIQIYIYFKLL